jgi:glycosyltransferase involved in cell wall biosynthesis
VDAFIAVSQYFAAVMKKKMGLWNHPVYPVYLGVDPQEYHFLHASEKPRTIGYISRMCHENGLDIAVDAFILLKKKPGFEDVSLCITGGSTHADSRYLSGIRKSIRKAGLETQVVFHEDFEGEGRMEFFSKVILASVPVRNGEAFGIYLTELMASGIPIIQPALGAFPEIVEKSEGGLVYTPNQPDVLAEEWAKVLSNPGLLSQLSIRARKGVEQYFDISVHTEEMIQVYQKVIAEKKNYVASSE